MLRDWTTGRAARPINRFGGRYWQVIFVVGLLHYIRTFMQVWPDLSNTSVQDALLKTAGFIVFVFHFFYKEARDLFDLFKWDK
jgi:hypothetical protein